MEDLTELSGGFGLKLSVARFYGPAGASWQGSGIAPDFPIPGAVAGDIGSTYSARPHLDPDADPQLRAALAVIGFERTAGR